MVDDLEKISLSVYVSNFPSHLTVTNTESLIASLSNFWIWKLRLHANVARFQRSTKKGTGAKVSKDVNEGSDSLITLKKDISCDYPLAILGCFKYFRSIANTRSLCHSEGFLDLEFKYLGRLRVLFEFTSGDVRNKFLNHKGVATWFSSLKPWHDDFSVEERLIWLEIEGVPLRAWEKDTFSSIARKWGELLFMDDSDACNRLSKRICIKSSHALLVFATIMVSVNDVTYAIRVRELCSWNPSFISDESECEEDDAMGNFEFDKEKNFDKSDVESVADLVADLESGEHKDNSYHDQEDVQEEVKLPKDCNIKDSPIDHCENNPPSDNDPFELASLINKRCGKQVEEQSFDTPIFPPGFAPKSPRENQASRSFHQNSTNNSQQPSFSMIQRLEETIKVGIALGLNMEGCENTLTSLLTRKWRF
ncbi:RNA-directed DNA polymerase, eukaryota, reverse transcriptase zinc-binding domain protein [Tanacetum coccineum]